MDMHTDCPARHPRVFIMRLKGRRVRRWESVPCSMLKPMNCILYLCGACNFVNIHGIVCPRCLGACTSDPGLNRDVSSRGLRRRVTSPSLLNDLQKAQLDRLERRAAIVIRSPAETQLPVVLSSGLIPHTTEQALENAIDTPSETDIESELRKGRRRAVRYSVSDIVAAATENGDMQSLLQVVLSMNGEDNGTSLRPRNIHCASVHSIMPTEDIDGRCNSPSSTTNPEMPTLICNTSHPALRRKRSMRVLRRRSSCSLRSSITLATSVPYTSRPQSDLSFQSIRSNVRKIRPDSPLLRTSADYVPLGDLKRPFYTAIRNNMSPPSKADPALTVLDSNAFQAAVFDRMSRSLDLPHPSASWHSSAPTPAYITSRRSTGFSVSGTTELRMSLGRVRSNEDVDPAYKFARTERTTTVGGKVKSLGRGIKDIFLRRAA